MSESLTSYFPFDRALRATLSHLELILREAGDNETCDLLRKILESLGQITTLHQIFASNLKRTIRDDSALSERRLWFQSFLSQSGENLNEKQVNKLTNITKNWALSEERVEALLLCSVLWSSCP
ncbi:hypothetical protein ACN38_g11316 [Penicillium nordicum]|uniref:Uncharacterized protein n=1 Tax=Penicillium nordicum TaxID=229535 RepID=A0A0M8NYZ7_9EURO|nr:hypothetical protein ACN38_g11316 [Penicillium nordicum]